jgi:organic radical activating enzyme
MYINLPPQLSFQDYPEVDKWAILVYFQGCNRNCNGCQNTNLKSEKIGQYFTPKDLHLLLQKYTKKWHTNCVVFTGGDPLMSRQLPTLLEFLIIYGNLYQICIYTGADQLEIVNKLSEASKGNSFKYIKGGKFIKHLKTKNKIGKTDTRFQLASTNQFFLDTHFTKLTTNGVLYYED